MLNIAPLDYERYAVLVNPLPAADARHIDAATPSRRVEQTDPVSTALGRADPQVGKEIKGRNFGLAVIKGEPIERDSEQPLNEPHPTDLNWFYQASNEARNSILDQPAIDPRAVIELYERPQKTPSAIVRVLG